MGGAAVAGDIDREAIKDIEDIVRESRRISVGDDKLLNNFINQDAAEVSRRKESGSVRIGNKKIIDTGKVGGVHVVQDTSNLRAEGVCGKSHRLRRRKARSG